MTDAGNAGHRPKESRQDRPSRPPRGRGGGERRPSEPGRGPGRGPARTAGRGPGRKAPGRGGPAKGKGREPATSPTTARAREIAERSGLPMALAREVAEGKCTLNDALYRLMRREKAERLVEQHGLDRSAAFNVAAGHITLEAALLQKGLTESEARQPDRSVLMDLRASGQAGCFFLFGDETLQAKVTAVDTYDAVLALEGGTEERRLPKHELRFVAPELSQAEVEPLLGRDDAVGAEGLGPSTSYRDRFRSSKKVLYLHHRDRVPTRVTLRDGAVLTGFVGWFGKWEFELALIDPRKKKPAKAKPVGTVVIFRHALRALGPLG